MDWRERIVQDPKILVGKATIKGTRLSVELIVDLLAQGWTYDDVLGSYPGITREDILACLAYAAAAVEAQRRSPVAAGV